MLIIPILRDCMGAGPWIEACKEAVCIPVEIAKGLTVVYNVIKFAVPALLILIGMFDMAKAITAKNEEDIKKAQNLLVKKTIIAFLVYFLFIGVLWMLKLINDTNGNTEAGVSTCLESLFNYDENTTKSSKGATKGYSDVYSVCRGAGYAGVLKLFKSGSDAFYVCYQSSAGHCNNGNGDLYILETYDYERKCLATSSEQKKLLESKHVDSTITEKVCVSAMTEDLGEIKEHYIEYSPKINNKSKEKVEFVISKGENHTECSASCYKAGYKDGKLTTDNNKCVCFDKMNVVYNANVSIKSICEAAKTDGSGWCDKVKRNIELDCDKADGNS